MYSKKFFLLILIIISLLLVGCESTYDNENIKVSNQQKAFQENQPIPSFDWSLERDVLIQLYKTRNEAVATYTVVTSSFGNLLWECPSIGYPLSAEIQLTNPQRIEYSANGNVTIPQPEPNGLYSGGSFGTWILCVLDNGDIYPVYTEMNANTFPFVVKVGEDGVIRNIENNKPVMTIKLNK